MSREIGDIENDLGFIESQLDDLTDQIVVLKVAKDELLDELLDEMETVKWEVNHDDTI